MILGVPSDRLVIRLLCLDPLPLLDQRVPLLFLLCRLLRVEVCFCRLLLQSLLRLPELLLHCRCPVLHERVIIRSQGIVQLVLLHVSVTHPLKCSCDDLPVGAARTALLDCLLAVSNAIIVCLLLELDGGAVGEHRDVLAVGLVCFGVQADCLVKILCFVRRVPLILEQIREPLGVVLEVLLCHGCLPRSFLRQLSLRLLFLLLGLCLFCCLLLLAAPDLVLLGFLEDVGVAFSQQFLQQKLNTLVIQMFPKSRFIVLQLLKQLREVGLNKEGRKCRTLRNEFKEIRAVQQVVDSKGIA
mmetsp:Transcript_24884/g.50539  ORF Transcript_24884/g.50539 Transcript_24884/m.50539 type:complete len:299 (+) Transcript_24884:897-1793(+)